MKSLWSVVLAAGLAGCASDEPPAGEAPAAEEAPPPQASPAPEQEPAERPAPGPNARVNIEVEDADLAEVVEVLGERVGAQILVDAGVKETITVKLMNIPWREALEVIAKMTRCEIDERAGALVLRQVSRVTIADAAGGNPATVLGLLAAHMNKRLELHPSIKGALPDDLVIHGDFVADALDWVCKPYDAVWVSVGDTLYVGPEPWAREKLGED